jgi:hypothetical protein
MNLIEKLGIGTTLVVGILIITGLILAITGWVGNIIKLTDCDFKAPYTAEVIRCTGIVIPPVGMIAGWLYIDDTPYED